MNREKIDHRKKLIKEINTRFFWKQCFRCDLEFKKEKMFRLDLPVQYGLDVSHTYYYLCEKCCPTTECAYIIYSRLERNRYTPKNVFEGL